MKLKFTAPKPRNPLVAASHQRLAGAHRRSNGAMRQQARQALKRELRTGAPVRPEPHSP